MIYGVGNAAWTETCNLNMLILSAATKAMQITTAQGGGFHREGCEGLKSSQQLPLCFILRELVKNIERLNPSFILQVEDVL